MCCKRLWGKHVSRVHVFHNIVNILFSPDTWYVLTSGSDKEGCGRAPGSACSTLLYLLQQVNRTHLPPSTGIRISTDKSLTIDQQAGEYKFICPVYLGYQNVNFTESLTWVRFFQCPFGLCLSG